MKRIGSILGSVLFVSFAMLAGCGGGGGKAQQPDPTITFVNGSPDSVAMNSWWVGSGTPIPIFWRSLPLESVLMWRTVRSGTPRMQCS